MVLAASCAVDGSGGSKLKERQVQARMMTRGLMKGKAVAALRPGTGGGGGEVSLLLHMHTLFGGTARREEAGLC